jgi:hypothetical protein
MLDFWANVKPVIENSTSCMMALPRISVSLPAGARLKSFLVNGDVEVHQMPELV